MTRGRFQYFSFSDESRKKYVPGMKTREIYYVFDVINHIQFLDNMSHIILTVCHPKQAFDILICSRYTHYLFCIRIHIYNTKLIFVEYIYAHNAMMHKYHNST